MKKLKYPNKNYLIKKAIKLFPEYKKFTLIGFRTFNNKNKLKTKIWVLEERIKNWKIDLDKPIVLIVCKLLKEKTPLELEEELINYLNNKYENLLFVDEKTCF